MSGRFAHCNATAQGCHNCGRLVDLRWDLCPYCGVEQGEHVPLICPAEAAATPPTARIEGEARRLG